MTGLMHKVGLFGEEMRGELLAAERYVPAAKDILIVVRDELEFVRACFESVFENTDDFTLWVFDNGSGPETASWLRTQDVRLTRSEENLGFIRPNNLLAAQGTAPYLILLNSDTVVFPGWEKAMIAHLQQDPRLGQVGYQGSVLDSEAMGRTAAYGRGVDYVTAWCMCLPRPLYEVHGLFDEENLEFAYGEDSDLSFRLREAGYGVHALHLDLVWHFGGKTIKTVAAEHDTTPSFVRNHEYLKRRWANYLRGVG